MRSMNTELHKFDLNLMKVFLAIWELQSVTAASERLGLTQPAVSHGLRRLREHFQDPLFTRVGHVMAPTATATELYKAFDQAMQTIGQSMQQQRQFDPATTARVFRIAMSDVSEFYFLPALLAHLETRAPRARAPHRSCRGGWCGMWCWWRHCSWRRSSGCSPTRWTKAIPWRWRRQLR